MSQSKVNPSISREKKLLSGFAPMYREKLLEKRV